MAAARMIIRESLNVGCAMGAGDMITQFAMEKKRLNGWDYGRSLRFTALGVFIAGPVLHKWYATLDTLVQPKQPLFRRAIKKMIINQSCFAPPSTLMLSFIVPWMNGEQPDELVKRLKRDYFSIMVTNNMVWCPAQIFNFAVVPLRYQVVFAQLIAILWNCYLSYKLN